VLPDVTRLAVICDNGYDWLGLFHGAMLEKPESVTFGFGCEQIGDFLRTFERVVLAASAQNTPSIFRFHTSRSWIQILALSFRPSD